MKNIQAVNKHIVKRLIIYHRLLCKLDQEEGREWITSNEIAQAISINPAQVRKDLSCVDRKGKTGVGYNIKILIDDIDKILYIQRTWGLVLIGAGNLGRALFYYPGFKSEGFEFRMVVDSDVKKIGKKWNGIEIESPKNMKKKIKSKNIDMALIAVPENCAQEVVNELVSIGIKEILNFAPVVLNVPEDVNIRYNDLSLQLRDLAYYLCKRKRKR